MKRNRLRSCVIVGQAILAVVILAGPIMGAREALAKNDKEVIVVNDVAQAVPVQIQGTADVYVVNRAAVEAVQKTQFVTFASGSAFSGEATLYTVPAGKRLVIDSVTIASNLTGASQQLMHVLFSVTNDDIVPYTISVQPVAEGLFAQTGANVFRKTVAITAYAAPGTAVTAIGTRDGTIDSLDSLMVGFSGHLVDAP